MGELKVRINDMLGSKNSYGYFAGEIYTVTNYTAISYKVLEPKEKAGWQIYHAHCTEIN